MRYREDGLVPRSLFKRAIQLYAGISLIFSAKYAAVYRGRGKLRVNGSGREKFEARPIFHKFRSNFERRFYDYRDFFEDRFKLVVL